MDQGYNISIFEKGAILIRCCSAFVPASITEYDDGDSVIESRRQVVASVVHNEFRTDPVKFIAVENGVIYLEPVQQNALLRALGHTGGHVYKLIHEYWQDGWVPFEVPEGLTLEQCL